VGQRVPEAARVFGRGDALPQVAQDAVLHLRVELAQIARRVAMELDSPNRWHGNGAC
jgi:hypothetical protein